MHQLGWCKDDVKGIGHIKPKFYIVEDDMLHRPFVHCYIGKCILYNHAVWAVFTQSNFSAQIFNRSTILFSRLNLSLCHPLGKSVITCLSHLKLIGKLMIDFLFLTVERFNTKSDSVALRVETCWRWHFLKGLVSLHQLLDYKGRCSTIIDCLKTPDGLIYHTVSGSGQKVLSSCHNRSIRQTGFS